VKYGLAAGVLALSAATAIGPDTRPAALDVVQFVFSSDAHYGLVRDTFRGASRVPARTVNRALSRRPRISGSSSAIGGKK
jgi:hypothetical protein